MMDHITLSVTDYARSKAFYVKALAPLGVTLVMEFDDHMAGFGRDGKPSFWIGSVTPTYWKPEHRAGAAPIHVAFTARTRTEVDAFHAAALAAGGTDFGAPGVRPEYHPSYYGAFVLDPDGNDVEAVIHG
jgi:catechol 2,3-dioxygenase-like lactoylglutathione lyase family enzyme